MFAILLAALIPVFSFQPPLLAVPLEFSASPFSTTFVVDSQAATNVYQSTTSPSVLLIPGVLRVKGVITISSESVGYVGIGVGTSTRCISIGIQANDYGAMYDDALPNGGGGNNAIPGFITIASAIGNTYQLELDFVISSSSNIWVTGFVNGMPVGSTQETDINLTGPVTHYLFGAGYSDISILAYNSLPF